MSLVGGLMARRCVEAIVGSLLSLGGGLLGVLYMLWMMG